MNLDQDVGSLSGAVAFTVWMTQHSSFLCPSDGRNQNGFRTFGAYDPVNGQWPAFGTPLDPSTGQPARLVGIANYSGSFGDNYCIGYLTGTGGPWETPFGSDPPPGTPRIGWPDFWGTALGNGTLRGFFDFGTNQVAKIADTTDGTSTSIIVGEALPYQDAMNSLWGFNRGTLGMTVPLNWRTSDVPGVNGCAAVFDVLTAWNCRYAYSFKGFKSEHPGGANFLFADGSVKFVKQTIQHRIYCALGSRNGGEVISSEDF
jgi:prepilin-type processing-associated H-X9-DG protein